MKVLVKTCAKCGYVMIFSVERLCQPGSDNDFGTRCAACGRQLGLEAVATELDIEELTNLVDVRAIAAALRAKL